MTRITEGPAPKSRIVFIQEKTPGFGAGVSGSSGHFVTLSGAR